MAPAYPPGSIPHYVSYAGNYPNQAVASQTGGRAQVVSSTPCHADQEVAIDGTAAVSVQGPTSVTYSSQGQPPAYQEKQQPFHAS